MKKERADKVLVGQGLAESRQKAQALIMAGHVSGPGGRIDKSGQLIDPATVLAVAKPLPFVSRGGLKLEQALDEFGVSPAGLMAADIGSSTGGFTDCLLQRGAVRVYAVDVDIRQLDDRLRRDPRVVAIQKNARNLVRADFPPDPAECPSLFVMDVSFISILKILPALRTICKTDGDHKQVATGLSARRNDDESIARNDRVSGPNGHDPDGHALIGVEGARRQKKPILLTLIKPQFEAGRGQVGKKGIVRDPALHAEILARVASEAGRLGFALRGLVRCSARGRTGNQEFFARWEPGGMEPGPDEVLKWIAAVTVS
ncbi:MAG: TlyA family RNA methyltransferase [Acidobacteriota bacterium]|nr:TlyA family RNA methyltransferase [Acidobacteriota bacterium]